MIKLIVMLKRKEGLSRTEFSRYWREVHAPLVARTAEVSSHMRRYVQNHIPAVSDTFDSNASTNDEGFDGIFECWYDNLAALSSCTGSQAYRDIIHPDELEFIDHARCISYIVDEHIVIG